MCTYSPDSSGKDGKIPRVFEFNKGDRKMEGCHSTQFFKIDTEPG